jgi:tetratricopeptide (TPR) repeat protein
MHALDYLEYAYLQTGRVEQAKEVLDRATRAASFDAPAFQVGYSMSAIPARYVLERRAWKEAAELEPPKASLPWERFNYARGVTYFARAIGAARSGDAAAARLAVDELKRIQTGLGSQAVAGPYDWAGQVETMRLAAAGWLAQAEGKSDEAVGLLRQAAELQDKVGKHPVTPGEVLPARELLADLLADLGRPKEALVEYEATLVDNPGRLNALRGAATAAEQAGQGAKAKEMKAAIAKQVGES